MRASILGCCKPKCFMRQTWPSVTLLHRQQQAPARSGSPCPSISYVMQMSQKRSTPCICPHAACQVIAFNPGAQRPTIGEGGAVADVAEVVHALQGHQNAFQAIRYLHRRHGQGHAARLLEVGELRDLL